MSARWAVRVMVCTKWMVNGDLFTAGVSWPRRADCTGSPFQHLWHLEQVNEGVCMYVCAAEAAAGDNTNTIIMNIVNKKNSSLIVVTRVDQTKCAEKCRAASTTHTAKCIACFKRPGFSFSFQVYN